MIEWDVIPVIVGVIGLVSPFVKAAVVMTKALQKNTDATDRLAAVVENFLADNAEDHKSYTLKLDDQIGRAHV